MFLRTKFFCIRQPCGVLGFSYVAVLILLVSNETTIQLEFEASCLEKTRHLWSPVQHLRAQTKPNLTTWSHQVQLAQSRSRHRTWLFFSSTLQPWNVLKSAHWQRAKLTPFTSTNKQLCSSSICILPDLWSNGYPASREMSLFSTAPGAALSSAVQISVCLILTAPIHHCRARRLSPERRTAANKATFPRDGCLLAPLLSSPVRFCFLCTSFVCFNSLIPSVCKLLSVSVNVFVSSLDFMRFSLSSLSFCSPLLRL